MQQALSLRGIEKSFGDQRVLSQIGFDVAEGEFIALVGPSGCGKSTLLRIIAGLERADHGAVVLHDRDVTDLRAAERDMAMVFQSYALYPHLTARQNMALPLAMRRLSAFERLPWLGRLSAVSRAKHAAIMRDVETMAQALRITELLDRKPTAMSGGQRQRVALGRAVVRHPKAFLMDEPLSNLDAALRVTMRDEIVNLHRQVGVMTLYVTHDQEEALGMADRVAVMMDGRIVQIAPPAVVYHDPDHLDVACFIGSPKINLMQGDLRAGSVFYAGQIFATGFSDPDCDVTIGIRPEHLVLSGKAEKAALELTVNRFEFLGAEIIAHLVDPKDGRNVIARASAELTHTVSEGKVVYATVDLHHVYVFRNNGIRLRRKTASSTKDASNAT